MYKDRMRDLLGVVFPERESSMRQVRVEAMRCRNGGRAGPLLVWATKRLRAKSHDKRQPALLHHTEDYK